MNSISKKKASIIFALTSILLSRAILGFFDDPEGPNLLVVFGGALILWLASFLVYKLIYPKNINRAFWLALLTQILIVIYFFFRH